MRDNTVLILAEGRFEGHITRRKQRGGPRYYAAELHTRGTGTLACPASQWASYDAAQAWLLHQAAAILEAEADRQGAELPAGHKNAVAGLETALTDKLGG